MPDKQETPSIIVIGAGIIGAAITFHLADRNARVRVLDAAEPGQGASAVSFAWINARDKNPRHYHDLNRRSLDMWHRFESRLGDDVGLTWGGELRWAASPEEGRPLRDRILTLQTWGYPIRLLDPTEFSELEPGITPGTLSAASYSAADGHVDTHKVIQACLEKATEKGARVSPHTPAVGLEISKSGNGPRRIEAVRVGAERIPCDSVILAGGPDSPDLAAQAGIDLPMHHTFGATAITEPIQALLQHAAVVHTPAERAPQIALRQLEDGSVMIHGGDGGTTSESLGRSDAEMQQVVAAAASYFPALEGVHIKTIRRGRRPMPDDGHPILGFTHSLPNLYLAITHSGVTLAALIGEIAAMEILDGVQVDLFEPYRLERFMKIK